jgi:type I restriction enzyme S subunit
VRDGWEVKRLGDLILPSGTIDPTKAPDQTFRYVDVSSVSNQTFEIGETSEIIGRDAPSRARRLIKSGDVIFATIRPTLKRIAIVPPHLDGEVCSTGYFVFRPRPNLNGKFLYYHLFTDEFIGTMERIQTGASYPAVNDTQVKEQKIAFPSLPTQKLIVAILDEAFEGIAAAVANAEQNLANARELFESYLNSVFSEKGEGWVEEPIAQIATKIGSGATPRGGQESYKSEGIPLIRSLNVRDRKFKYYDIAFLHDEQAEKLDNVIVQKGDVLLNITGASVARCCQVPDDVLPARVNQHVSIIRPVQSIVSPRFLEYALTTRPNKDRLLGVGEKGGSTRQAITKTEIQEFRLAYPPIDAQAVMTSRLDELSIETSRLENIYQQKLDSLAELKQAVLQKAFAGEMTAQPGQVLQEAVV